MTNIHTTRIPAQLSRTGKDEIYYVTPGADWHKQMRRLQQRRRHKLYHLEERRSLYDKRKEQL